MNFLKGWACTLLVCLIPNLALAQMCASLDRYPAQVEKLKNEFGETLFLTGTSVAHPAKFEMYFNAEKNTYTILYILDDTFCLPDAGRDLKIATEKKGEPV